MRTDKSLLWLVLFGVVLILMVLLLEGTPAEQEKRQKSCELKCKPHRVRCYYPCTCDLTTEMR